jgi:hypothetical protein
MLCNLFLSRNVNAESYTTWVIYGNSNPYLTVDTINNNEIVLVGEHHTRQNAYMYKSDGFVMRNESYRTTNSYPDGGLTEGRINTENIDYVAGELTYTTYIMKVKDFLRAAANIGITGESIGNSKVTVYLQTIFDTYIGDKRTANNILGLQEMLNAPKAFGLGFDEWDPQTQLRLPSYYNMRFDLTAKCTYNLKVVAIDEDGLIIKDNIINKKVIYNEPFPYTPNKEINVSNSTYTYSGRWKYSYLNRDPEQNKNISWSNTDIAFNVPDAMPGSTLTVYVEYKKEKTPYKVNIKAVDKNDSYKEITTIREITQKDYYAGDEFTYSVPDGRLKINNIYNYQYEWYLKYTDKNGTVKKTNNVQSRDIYYKPMPDAKENSVATFYMVYAKGTPITPTPTPTPKPGVPTPTPKPSVTPTPGAPTPTPYIEQVVVPEPDYAGLPFPNVTATGSILADLKTRNRFIATMGVPTTESLYGEVRATEYLIGYQFEKKVGLKYYPIKVSKEYTLKWKTATPEEAGGGKPIEEKVKIGQIITVPRAYGYWEIKNLEYYNINKAVLNNYALPSETITLYPNTTYYSPPSINYYHNSDEDYHIIPPREVTTGIILPPETITGDIAKPMIPKEDFSYYALSQTGKIKVKSDSVTFKGITVMSDSVAETEAPTVNRTTIQPCTTLTKDYALFKDGQVIEATKLNGTYSSNGSITYTSVAAVGATRQNNINYPLGSVNKVVLHTPVICKPTISANNDKYVQLVSPTSGCTQLVLDPDPALSDFTVNISNVGLHTEMLGYYTRDFSKSLRDPNVSYIALGNGILRNEVKFPFDVYMDEGKDNKAENDTYVKSGTWIVIGRSTPRFYLPMWVPEGTYTVDFRTVAVNGTNKLLNIEKEANRDRSNYVATATQKVEVSGRLYGLTIYDISDYPMWKEAFRVPNSTKLKLNDTNYQDGTKKSTYSKSYSYAYSLGTNDQYGNDTGKNSKYTFPLVNGSHPQYKNIGVIKTGYLFRFKLDTTGEMLSDGCKVVIKPSFYFIDSKGKNRTQVDLYYSEEIDGKSRHLVKMGSAMDQINIKSLEIGDIHLSIPEQELKQTATLRGMTYGKYIWKRSAMFNFTDIRLNDAFRTFVNNTYAAKIASYDSYDDIRDDGIKESDILKRMQRWYGQYYLPNEVHAVAKGYDVMDYVDKYGVDYDEDFWLIDGYIIVNFNIYTVDGEGKKRLSYTNASNYKNLGHCCMWELEGPVRYKTDNNGTKFTWYAGDVALYYANKRASDDYQGGAVY